MSTISAGLVNVTNLTVTGTQSGAVTATNFNFTNLDLSGNLSVDGTTHLKTLDVQESTILNTLDVSGSTVLNTLDVQESTILNTLDVQGSTILNTLDVSGNATVKTQPLEISSTLVATTEYVHQYSEILNNLHNKTFSIPLVFVLYEGMQPQGLPSASIITFTFYNNRDVKFVCGTENLEQGGSTQQSTQPFPNTIFGKFEIMDSSEITIKINYLNGNKYNQIPGTRYLYLTFNDKCDAITKVVEDSDGLIELRTLASTITDFDVSGNFLSEFILSYQDNSGNSLFNIDASGNYNTHCDTSGIIVDTSGVIGNINDIYLLDTVNWKIPVQAALISTNINVVKSIINGRIYSGKLDYITNVNMKTYSAGLVIANKEHTFGYSPVTGIPDGILVDYKSDTTASIKSNDIYTIPMEFEHSDKRLNGVSRSYFEPIHNEIFLGRNCTYTEPVNADSSGNPARLKHIATRGIDVIAMHSRIHIDPSVYCYTKGRNILYCRHSQTWLNNTFWYPDGPEFRISLAPALTVTKLLFNGVEIPGYMIKRKSWDRYYDNTESNLRDDKAITFNIAKATQYVSGFTMKYSSDPSGNYVLADLNKVEIWYQGNTLYPVSITLSNRPTIIWGISNDGVPLNTSLGNIQFNDHLTTMQTKYSIPGPPIDKILNGLTKDGLIVWPNINVNSSLINDYNTQVSFWPNDPRPDHLNAFVPINDLCNDAWYLQFEMMCPKPFNVATGGKQLTPIESSDGNSTLYKFVPGYMDTSGSIDHKSNYGTAFAFNVTEYKSKEFQITLTSGKQIPYYLHAPQQFIDAVIDGSLNNLAYLQPASIQKTVRIMESILSPYPHETIGISFTQDAGSAAMEHREMVSMGNNVSFATIIHEIIHQWWQNLISFNSNREFWTDEGFDTFIMFFVMDMYFKDGTNRAYAQNIGTKQKEIVNIGFGNKSISNYIGSADYPNVAYAWALMYYNWGSSNKVDSSNNLIVRPMDISGNEVIRIIGDSYLDTRGWGLMNKSDLYNYDYASIIIDSSGTIAFVNSLYQIVDSSYNRINRSGINLNVYNPQVHVSASLHLYLKKIDGNPIIQEDYYSGGVVLRRNLVDVLGNTVTNYVTMPSASMERYYASYDSSGVVNLNTYYMDCIKLIQTNFAEHFYTTTDIANTFGDYVDVHFADWSGNNLNTGCWPSCKLDILVYWNEVLRIAGNDRKFTDNYPLNYDTDYLPVGVNINPVPTPTIITYNGGPDLAPIGKFILYSWAKYQAFDLTAPVLWLQDGLGNALLGGSLDDFTTHGQDFTGKIAFIQRGIYTGVTKVSNAQAAGAVGAVLYVLPGQLTFNVSISSAFNLYIPFITIGNTVGLDVISQSLAYPTRTMNMKGNFVVAS